MEHVGWNGLDPKVREYIDLINAQFQVPVGTVEDEKTHDDYEAKLDRAWEELTPEQRRQVWEVLL